MKVLITGSSGTLGMNLKKVLKENDLDVYATFHRSPIEKEKSFQLDVTLAEDVDQVLKKVTPDVVVHTAAYTNVDGCEKDRDTAFAVNAQGTRNLADSTEKMGAKFVYISTDYVFDGVKGFYKEKDATNPINYYGTTKLEGEEAVKKICSEFIIARTSVIYGANTKNFVTWVVDALEKGKHINIATDQHVSPTLNTDLAKQLVALIEKDTKGVFHTAGGERISRYDFVKVIADLFGLDKNLINPVRMTDINWIARRPMDSSLDVSKISKVKKPCSVKESVKSFRKERRN